MEIFFLKNLQGLHDRQRKKEMRFLRLLKNARHFSAQSKNIQALIY